MIEIIASYVARCDRCKELHEDGEGTRRSWLGRQDAIDGVMGAGWMVYKDGLYCDQCIDRDEFGGYKPKEAYPEHLEKLIKYIDTIIRGTRTPYMPSYNGLYLVEFFLYDGQILREHEREYIEKMMDGKLVSINDATYADGVSAWSIKVRG